MKIKVKAVLLIIFILVGALVLTACNVDVESVSISGPDIAAVNIETQYTATVSPSDATYRQATWAITGDNTVGATISNDGIFKATAAGSVTITATAGGKSNSKTITVQFIEATAVSVSNVSGVVGNPITLKANLTPSDASNTVTYSLVDNTIGAVLTGNQVTCGNLGTVSYKATVGSLESNTSTITFTLDPANGETITTAEQLNAVRNNLSGKFQLGADIDLGGYTNWTPIGTSSAPFSGQLSGNGYTVSNLTINTLSTDGVGLFGNINDKAVIKNLKVNANITAGIAGGIAGNSKGSITDCEVSGTIGKSNADYIGGIVAKQTGGNISGNINNAVIIGASYLGGIAGYAELSSLADCENNGSVQATANNTGGIVGNLNFKSNNGSLVGCENSATIIGIGSIGGIVGLLTGSTNYNSPNSTVQTCVNNSVITGTGDNVGGICGYVNTTSSSHRVTITSCENNANINGQNYIGSYVGRGDNANFTGLINNNTITGGAFVGGIAGKGDTFTNCKNQGAINASGTVTESGSTNAYIGGIAGLSTNLSGCRNEVNIIYSKNANYVGGIVGYANATSITNCQNTGAILSSGSNVGGIAGYVNFGSNSSSISGCENLVTIQGIGNIGGIAGLIYGNTNYNSPNSSVQMCVNDSAITGTGDNVGGICGYVNTTSSSHKVTITSSENNANVSGLNYVGSYVGRGDNANFTGLINNNTITGGAFVGGITGRGSVFTNCENKGAVNANGTITESGSTNAYVGGITGYSTSLSGCKNEVNITYTKNANYVGGIAGYSVTTSITNCQNTGAILSSGNNVGGITGYVNFGSSSSSISGCENSATVRGVANIGGIVGSISGNTNYNSPNSSIQMCVNNSAITGTDNNIGGICGSVTTSGSHNITFASCQNKANISGASNAFTGGILGGQTGNRVQPQSDCSNSGIINGGSGHALLP